MHDARRYRLQVAVDPLVRDADRRRSYNDASSYTSNTTYPSDTTLYWRVRADAEDGSGAVGLSWSESGTFTKQLPKPVWDPDNPTTGGFLPTIKWSTVPGAVSYDLHVVEPDGQARDFRNIPGPAGTFIEMTGVGVFTWTVRANFPTDGLSTVDGPYSLPSTFTHTIPEPSGTTEEVGAPPPTLAVGSAPARRRLPRPGLHARGLRHHHRERHDADDRPCARCSRPARTRTAAASSGGSRWSTRTDNVGDYSVARPFTLPAPRQQRRWRRPDHAALPRLVHRLSGEEQGAHGLR